MRPRHLVESPPPPLAGADPPPDVVEQRRERRRPRPHRPDTRPPGRLPESPPQPDSPGATTWRVSPLPPYLPAAAVLADGLWPELPERPVPVPAASPLPAVHRQARIEAEQEAT